MLQQITDAEYGPIRFFPPSRSTGGIVPVTRNWHSFPARSSPSWLQDLVLYEVFVRNFPPEGNFESVRRYLPVLQELGVNGIWLMPIHPIGRKNRKGRSGSPYSIRDHLRIHPRLGTESDLKTLVKEAHQRNMRVFLDLVLNHSANDHILMNSRPDFWKRDARGQFMRRVKAWSDISEFDFRNPDLRHYLIQVMRHWIEHFDIDGYRCDVAGFVPRDFWQEASDSVRKLKPDFVLLAEWEDPEFHLELFDLTYNWTFYYKLCDLANGVASASEVAEAWYYQYITFPSDAQRLHFLENHDERRAATVFGNSWLPYAALCLFLPGVPLLYSGQEWGLRDYASLFERAIFEFPEQPNSYWQIYKDLIQFRRQNPALRRGEFHLLPTDNRQVVAFMCRYNLQRLLLLFSFSQHQETVTLKTIPQTAKINVLAVFPHAENVTLLPGSRSSQLDHHQVAILEVQNWT